MATYDELRSAFSIDDLRHRVTVATLIAAQAMLQADPGTANGRKWALAVFTNPDAWGRQVFMSVLAENKDNSLAQISGASDAAIQTAVDSVVDALAEAHSGA